MTYPRRNQTLQEGGRTVQKCALRWPKGVLSYLKNIGWYFVKDILSILSYFLL